VELLLLRLINPSDQQLGAQEGSYSIHDAPHSLKDSHKRRCCGSSDRERENKRSIRALKAQVSYLQQLLRGASALTFSTPSQSYCPIKGCGRKYSRLDHIQKHIRQSDDPKHKTAAAIINETHCVDCTKTWDRPTDLVRHEKYVHRNRYGLRLEKISGLTLQSSPSPLSSSTKASDSSSTW